jgi:hypothetical protein
MSAAWVAALIVLWAVEVMTATVVIGILRRIGGVLERAEARGSAPSLAFGIPVASRAPEFRVFERNGRTYRELKSAELIDAPTILLFMEQNCPPCRDLAEELGTGTDQLERIPLRVILREHEGRPDWLHSAVPVVYERRREVSTAFENNATPQAYLLDTSRTVLAKRIVRSLSDLDQMARTLERPSEGGEADAEIASSYSVVE